MEYTHKQIKVKDIKLHFYNKQEFKNNFLTKLWNSYILHLSISILSTASLPGEFHNNQYIIPSAKEGS